MSKWDLRTGELENNRKGHETQEKNILLKKIQSRNQKIILKCVQELSPIKQGENP